MAKLEEPKNESEFDKILEGAQGNLVVVHFWAPWAAQCQQMTDVLVELAKNPKHANTTLVKVEAEAVPEVSLRFKVAAVPTCVLLKNASEVGRVDGANVPELTSKVEHHSGIAATPPAPHQDLNTRLKKLINTAPVMVFMKGTPEEPRCGFSRQLVEILKGQTVQYSSFNILTDEQVRQGLKEYSNWPTYPQLYASGELVGGLDIIKELVETGELKSQLPKQDNLDDRLKELLHRDKVMVFMKGSPDGPRCGFSKTLVGILAQTGVSYGHFDILQDEEVRQGLKKYSNWPTYPQLYVSGDLVGGLDIIKELEETGDLESTLKGD